MENHKCSLGPVKKLIQQKFSLCQSSKFYKGMKKRFNIGVSTTETIWKKYKDNNTRDNQVRLLKRKLSSLHTKAEDIPLTMFSNSSKFMKKTFGSSRRKLILDF